MYDLESHIVDIPDYPEPGVVFKDITPLFGNPEALKAMVDALAEHFADMGITQGRRTRGPRLYGRCARGRRPGCRLCSRT